MENNKRKLWPELLLLLVCAAWLLVGISQKEGYHMDELLSFELANAKFNPWIVPTQPQGRLAKYVEQEIDGRTVGETIGNLWETVTDLLRNRGDSKLLRYKADVYDSPVWITAEQFRNYITVGKGDAFQYLSVYFNVKDDNHPPLHFMVLHTVSSVFRGKLVPIMGCGINLVCVIGIMVLLLYLGRILCLVTGHAGQGRIAGFWMAALYGFSAGAMHTTLLIRMYGMLSFWCIALLAIHVKKLWAPVLAAEHPGAPDFTQKNKLLVLVTVCGFWTQYFFLFYCLILAGVTVVLLWRENRRKEVWHYIRSMVTAAGIGLIGFPFAISDVFSSGRGVEALANLSSGLDGYGFRLYQFGQILVQESGVVIWILVCILAVYCTVRKRIAMHDSEIDKNHDTGKRLWNGGIGTTGLVCLLVIPVLGYFLLAARMSPYLVDRYIMPVFPFVAFLALPAVCVVQKRPFLCGLVSVTILLQPVQALRCENPYFYEGYQAQLEIAKQHASSPCICIGEGVGYYENLLEFTEYEKTLLLTPKEFEEQLEPLRGLENAVVLLKTGVDRQLVCDRMEEYYAMHMTEVLQPRGGAHGDEILYLQVK